MEEVPSILSSKDVLRKRLTQEVAMKEAATAARAKMFWKQQWEQNALPLTTANIGRSAGRSPLVATTAATHGPPVVTTNAVYSQVVTDESWNQVSLFGLRRDRVLFGAHAICAVVHFVFFLVRCDTRHIRSFAS